MSGIMTSIVLNVQSHTIYHTQWINSHRTPRMNPTRKPLRDPDTSSGAYSSYINEPRTYDTYSNGQRKEPEKIQIKVPHAELYTVQSLPSSLATGTGIAYLSAEPCPLKAWIGTSPHGNTPLEPGVIDSGGPSLIAKRLIPPENFLFYPFH